MKPQPAPFRSKSERENEVNLLSNYREIGIAAIAAASQAARKDARDGAARRVAANLNHTD